MRSTWIVVVVIGVATIGCARDADDESAEAGPGRDAVTTSVATPIPSVATPSVPSTAVDTAAPGPPTADAAALCAATAADVIGTIANADLDEASGLASSRTHDGVLWSHNDGGGAPGVFAIGSDGADLGFHPLVVDGAVDVEDIAITTRGDAGAGGNGGEIFLADIGDNSQERESILVYRFDEPDPATPTPITTYETLEFVYPDGPHNAETLLVDEAADRLVIVTKEQEPAPDGSPDDRGRTAESRVFEGSLGGHGAGPVELVDVGRIDMPALEALTRSAAVHPATLLGFGGVPTSGDVSPDGTLVALRTYEAVWVWDRDAGQSIADSFQGQPCQVTTGPELQGEAVAFVDGGLVTVGEGSNTPLHRLGG